MKILTFILLLLFFQSQNDNYELYEKLDSKPKEYFIDYLDVWKQDSNGCQGKRDLIVFLDTFNNLRLDTLKFNSLVKLIGEPNKSYFKYYTKKEVQKPLKKYFHNSVDSLKFNFHIYFADSMMCNEDGIVPEHVNHLDIGEFFVMDKNDSIIGFHF